jgi:hypothetical protein
MTDLQKLNRELEPKVIHIGQTDFGDGGVCVLAYCGLTVLRRATTYDSGDIEAANCSDCRRRACLSAELSG